MKKEIIACDLCGKATRESRERQLNIQETDSNGGYWISDVDICEECFYLVNQQEGDFKKVIKVLNSLIE